MCLLLAKWGSPPDQKQFYGWVCLFFFSLFLFLWKLPVGLKHNNTLWEEGREERWVRLISGEPRGALPAQISLQTGQALWEGGAAKTRNCLRRWSFFCDHILALEPPVTPLSLSVLPSSPTAWLLGGRGGTLCDKCPCWRYGTLPCSAARACACLCLFILFVPTAFFYLSEIWTFLCPAFLSCLPSWLVLSCLFQRVSDKPHQVCASPHVRACLVLPPLSSETLSGTLESLHGKSFFFFSPQSSRFKD